jgi:hypothetical protein
MDKIRPDDENAEPAGTGDLDKKLRHLEMRLKLLDLPNEVVRHLDADVFEEIYVGWLGVLVERSIVLAQKFNRFFKEYKHAIDIRPAGFHVPFTDEKVGAILTRLSDQMVSYRQRLNSPEIVVEFQTGYESFIKGGLKSFDCRYKWTVRFDKIKYLITMEVFPGGESKTVAEKLLHQPLGDAAIDDLLREFGETLYTHIIEHAKRIGIDIA